MAHRSGVRVGSPGDAARCPLAARRRPSRPGDARVLAGPSSTDLLRNVLRRLGYRVYDWGLGYNLGYRTSMKEALPARLRQIRERADGRRVSIIGWSAGGIMPANWRGRARRRPISDHPGVPVPGQSSGQHRVEGVAVGQSRRRCRRGRRRNRVGTPRATVVGADDLHLQQIGRIVAWQCCTSVPAPETENIEVRSSHLGYGHNLQTLSVIADRLAQPETAGARSGRSLTRLLRRPVGCRITAVGCGRGELIAHRRRPHAAFEDAPSALGAAQPVRHSGVDPHSGMSADQ